MVDEEALNTFEQPISTIWQLAEVKLDKVPLVFNHGWGRMLATAFGEWVDARGSYLHHARECHDPATWGVAENSWRGGRLDEAGRIRYGWGNVADTFGEDPRWTDYIAEVRRGTSLTWKQYTAALYQNALDLQRPQQVAADRVYIKTQPMLVGPNLLIPPPDYIVKV